MVLTFNTVCLLSRVVRYASIVRTCFDRVRFELMTSDGTCTSWTDVSDVLQGDLKCTQLVVVFLIQLVRGISVHCWYYTMYICFDNKWLALWSIVPVMNYGTPCTRIKVGIQFEASSTTSGTININQKLNILLAVTPCALWWWCCRVIVIRETESESRIWTFGSAESKVCVFIFCVFCHSTRDRLFTQKLLPNTS